MSTGLLSKQAPNPPVGPLNSGAKLINILFSMIQCIFMPVISNSVYRILIVLKNGLNEGT